MSFKKSEYGEASINTALEFGGGEKKKNEFDDMVGYIYPVIKGAISKNPDKKKKPICSLPADMF